MVAEGLMRMIWSAMKAIWNSPPVFEGGCLVKPARRAGKHEIQNRPHITGICPAACAPRNTPLRRNWPNGGLNWRKITMERAREILRSGDWLTRDRIRLVAVALFLASTIGFLYLVLTAHGGIDLQGRPLGTDFSNVYAAGTYADEDNAAAAFDPARQFAREREIFGEATQFYGWPYPPYFLLVAAALALLPYGLALAVWQAVTLGIYLLVIRAIISPSPRSAQRADRLLWLLLALAYPAVLINVGHGQNGFLTAALFGGALVILDRRPLAAGVLFGCLVYKPQYGLMLPIVLAGSGRWRCFASAAATATL